MKTINKQSLSLRNKQSLSLRNKQSLSLSNKKAKFDYDVKDTIEAGLVLTGAEAKAVRANKVDFTGSYVKPLGGEMFVINLHIGAEGFADSRRSRKLLLNKKEIFSINSKVKQDKLTLIPLSLYTVGRLIKLELALVRGKRTHEKRAQIKAKDIERDLAQELNPKQ